MSWPRWCAGWPVIAKASTVARLPEKVTLEQVYRRDHQAAAGRCGAVRFGRITGAGFTFGDGVH